MPAPATRLALRIEGVGLERFTEVRALNQEIFGETRVINQLDRRDLTMLLAWSGERLVGFKVGYGENARTFYSAKGGVREEYRRRGIARALLYDLMGRARAKGYARFAYDTFPNLHPGMAVLGLTEGFTVTAAGYNAPYRDYRIRFEKEL